MGEGGRWHTTTITAAPSPNPANGDSGKGLIIRCVQVIVKGWVRQRDGEARKSHASADKIWSCANG